MKKIIFIRTADYNYNQPDLPLYDSLDGVGLQTIQPDINTPSKETIEKIATIKQSHHIDQVYCSIFPRSHQTALLFSKNYTATHQLNEIRFSMNDFTSRQELTGESIKPQEINIIRKQFADALLADTLQEKKEDIHYRMQSFINNLPTGTSLCMSHGFIMKLFENALLYPSPTYSVDEQVNAYDWRKPPYGFLQGVIITIDNEKRIQTYI